MTFGEACPQKSYNEGMYVMYTVGFDLQTKSRDLIQRYISYE